MLKKILNNLDEKTLLWLQDKRKPKLTRFMKQMTALGNFGTVWIVITVLLCRKKETRKVGVMSGTALLSSLVVNNGILKHLVARDRPYQKVSGLHTLVRPAADFSFPSGHTGSSMAVAWVICHELPKLWGIWAETLAFLISFSRLYVGIHFPTDVLGGMITGIFTGEFARRLCTHREMKMA